MAKRHETAKKQNILALRSVYMVLLEWVRQEGWCRHYE